LSQLCNGKANFTNKTPINYLLLLLIVSYAFASFPSANPTDAQKNFKQWIASERLISKELSDWEIQKAAIGDLIELLEEQEKSINENLEALENENSAGEEERIRLSDQNEDLKSAIVPVSETLQSLEKDILELLPRFPKPLQDDLQGFVGTGDSQMIAGFIVAGETGSTSTVTIRALGPTIAAAPYNVSGTISDSFLTLVDGTGSVVAYVDNWESSSSASAISSSDRNPGKTLENAHQIVFSPGNYTAIISGAGAKTGV